MLLALVVGFLAGLLVYHFKDQIQEKAGNLRDRLPDGEAMAEKVLDVGRFLSKWGPYLLLAVIVVAIIIAAASRPEPVQTVGIGSFVTRLDACDNPQTIQLTAEDLRRGNLVVGFDMSTQGGEDCRMTYPVTAAEPAHDNP